MIPSPDFYINIRIEFAEDVVRYFCATAGFLIATWGVVKITSILFGSKSDGG